MQFGVSRKGWGYAADRRPSTHPVAGNGAADAAGALNDFDGISYAKGAATLRQLAARGSATTSSWPGCATTSRRYAFGNAELADLLAAWTAAGARDIADWADQWLRTSGLDTLRRRRRPLRRERAAGPSGAARARAHGGGLPVGRCALPLLDHVPT